MISHADMNGKVLQMLVTHFLSLSLVCLQNTLPLLLYPKPLLTLHTQLHTSTAQQSPQSVSQSPTSLHKQSNKIRDVVE